MAKKFKLKSVAANAGLWEQDTFVLANALPGKELIFEEDEIDGTEGEVKFRVGGGFKKKYLNYYREGGAGTVYVSHESAKFIVKTTGEANIVTVFAVEAKEYMGVKNFGDSVSVSSDYNEDNSERQFEYIPVE